jgi:plasmid maintenance system antidote protein VapI
MTVKDLANLSEQSRELITNYLNNSGKTVNALANEAGVHPTQLWLFIRGDRGLTDASLQKIGTAILKNKGKK